MYIHYALHSIVSKVSALMGLTFGDENREQSITMKTNEGENTERCQESEVEV